MCIICAKGSLEDVYAALVMANGAVMEGIETKVFFTFFGLDAITKKQMSSLHTAAVGNPAMRMPGGLPFPTLLGVLPGVEAGVSKMMRAEMEKLDIPTVPEFHGTGRVFCVQTTCQTEKSTAISLRSTRR